MASLPSSKGKMSLIFIATNALLALIVFFYLFTTRKFKYWQNKNVPFLPPLPFFGNAFGLFTFQESFGSFVRRMYNTTSEPFIGLFMCDEPCLLVRDPELLKHILVKDFSVFTDRSVVENKRDDSMGANLLFNLKNPEWKNRRKSVSPIFTSGKMKSMFQLISAAGDDFTHFLSLEIEKNPVANIREFSMRYTTNAVTSTSFGVDANSFTDETSEFKAVANRVFNWAIWERVISMSCYIMAPKIVKLFRLRFVDKRSSDFLREIFWQTVSERREKKVTRYDLLDLLMELQDAAPEYWEGDKLVGLAAQFFIAGTETTSTALTLALYELAVNKNLQETLREEIREVVSKQGELSFATIKEMRFLDMCLKETLRKYPVLPFLDRQCKADYKIPGTDVIVEKGTFVLIPLWGLHYDPLYYPNPDVFDPLRFTEENVQSRPQFTYFPFGEGPRHCIGARFGELGAKIGVVKIISKFEVDLCEKTHHPIKLDNKGLLLAPVSGLWLKFRKLC